MAVHKTASIGFDRAVESYENGRPGYPADAIHYLIEILHLQSRSTVLDLAAGTGKFTRLLIPICEAVIAVEPLEGMRKLLRRYCPEALVIGGVSEGIPVQACCVDAVTVATAFHWFDGTLALPEIHRILKPGGRLGLIWNTRNGSSDFYNRFNQIVDKYEGNTPRYADMNWKNSFQNSSLFSPLQFRSFANVQVGTIRTIMDRVSSVSYIAALPLVAKREVLNQVSELLRDHPETKGREHIPLLHRTDVYWCQRM